MSKNIKLTGYYGMSNYGDDLFSLISYQAVIDNFKPSACSLIGPTINQKSSGYNLKFSKINSFYSELNNLGKITRFINYLSATYSTDYLMFCGGSLYNNNSTASKDVLYLMNFNRYKFHALGVSVGPFQSIDSEKRAIKTLSQYEYISLRDLKSYQRVSSYNLHAKLVSSADLAGLALDYFPTPKQSPTRSKQFIIGFSPCMFADGLSAKNFIAHFASNMEYAKKHLNFKVEILCLNQNSFNGDIELCNLANDMLKNLGIASTIIKYKDIGVQRTWERISSYDFFVSVRLHGAITAYLTETPFFLYEYQEKCTEFLNYINADTYTPEEYISDSTFLTRIITQQKEEPNLLNVKLFVDKAKLNITENPLYTKS